MQTWMEEADHHAEGAGTVALALPDSVIEYHRSIGGIDWMIDLLGQAQLEVGLDKAGREGHMVIRAVRPSGWERDRCSLPLLDTMRELRKEARMLMPGLGQVLRGVLD